MKRSDKNASELNEYIEHERYKISFILMLMITTFLILIDNLYNHQITQLSIALTIKLQKFDLYYISLFFDYFIYGLMYLYVLGVYIIRKNQESNFSLIFGTFFLMYVSAILKLIMVGNRPFFINNKLNEDFCICDYGKPSAHSIIGLGTTMLIYTDLIHNNNISKYKTIIMKIFIVLIQFGVLLSRLYLGAHTINHMILGWCVGLTVFFGLRRINDYMQKYIIWPIFYKDRFQNKPAIFHLLFHMTWTNYLVFWLWSYRYTKFDVKENSYFNFDNCKICIADIGHNFSVNVVRDALWFNIFFGMMLGVYISKTTRFTYAGLYDEGEFKLFICRVSIFLLCISPLILAYYPIIDIVIITFLRMILFCVFIGMFSTSVFYSLLEGIGLPIRMLHNSNISIISDFIDGFDIKN